MKNEKLMAKIKLLLLLVMVPSVVTLGMMFVDKQNAKVMYQATTKLLIQPDNTQNEMNKESQELYQKLTYVIADLANDTIVLDELVSQYQKPLTVQEAKLIISSTQNQHSQSVLISATTESDQKSKEISLLTAKIVKAKYKELQGVDYLQIVDVPTETMTITANSRLKLLVTFVGTLFLMLLLYFIIKF